MRELHLAVAEGCEGEWKELVKFPLLVIDPEDVQEP